MRLNKTVWHMIKNLLRLGLLSALVFVLLLGGALAAPPPEGPSEVNLTQLDNGSKVQLTEDQVLVLRLPGNPSTGYVWQPAGSQLDGAVLRKAAMVRYEYLDAAAAEERLDVATPGHLGEFVDGCQ